MLTLQLIFRSSLINAIIKMSDSVVNIGEQDLQLNYGSTRPPGPCAYASGGSGITNRSIELAR